MSKPAKKQTRKTAPARAKRARAAAPKSPPRPKAKATDIRKETGERSSKQSRVIEMLQSSAGTTIAAIMKSTGWQQHSVRGFLAGVVRKRLKLNLDSLRIDGDRVYRIIDAGKGKPGPAEAKQRSS
jgi:hypothetical protein